MGDHRNPHRPLVRSTRDRPGRLRLRHRPRTSRRRPDRRNPARRGTTATADATHRLNQPGHVDPPDHESPTLTDSQESCSYVSWIPSDTDHEVGLNPKELP